MTEAITSRDLPDDETRTLNLLLAQLEKKAQRNRLRSAYYDMKHIVRRMSTVIPPQYWRMGIVLGWNGKSVDTLARRCNLDAFTWPKGDLESIGGTVLWDDNHLGSEVSQAMTSSLIHSVAFGVNTTGADGEPNSLIHFRDALNATGEWNVRRRRLDSFLSVTERSTEASSKGKPIELTLYLDGLTIPMLKVDGKWEVLDRHEHDWHVPADPLPYRPRLGRPFGSSRITRASMSAQDRATMAAVRLEAHSDIYTIPDLWMLGADQSIFKNADGSQKESWQIVMGRIKGIPDDPDAESDGLARAEVKQFPAASPEAHLKTLKQQAELFSGETAIPISSLGVSDQGNPTSADSYIASREDLIAEAEGATDDWKPGLRSIFIRGLAMANGIAADDVPAEWAAITPKFRKPVYLSRAAEADAGMKQLTAIPWLADTEVGLDLLGLSESQKESALAERRRSQGSDLLDRALNRTEAMPSAGAEDAAALKAKADALGALIRSGVNPEDAAAAVGLPPMRFTGAMPVGPRLPVADAAELEE